MKPILFNTEMVRAIMDGHKTVTRRVVKLKYSNTHLEMFTNKYGTRLIEKQNEVPGVTTIKNPDGTTTHTLLACIEKEPSYRPGDILYVRETWAPFYETMYSTPVIGYRYYSETDEEIKKRLPEYLNWFWPGRWRPSIHMPREAARIFLRVTDVRVEHIQSMTMRDIQAEGVVPYDVIGGTWQQWQQDYMKPVWNSTIKPADRALYGWETNPWVWVIEFERISKEAAYGLDAH